MNYLFTSERLGFRAWQADDLEPFAAMNMDSNVMEFFPSTLSKAQTAAMIERMQAHHEKHGYCFFAVDALEDGNFIGFIGLNYQAFDMDFAPCVEIGWRLQHKNWGKGYATEGAKRCLKYGFEVLKAESIYSFTSLINAKSEKVMDKIGMKKISTFEHPQLEEGSKLRPHVLYRINSEEIIP